MKENYIDQLPNLSKKQMKNIPTGAKEMITGK